MADKNVPPNGNDTGYFGSAIDDATMATMESAASSKQRGLERRFTLVALASDSEALGKMSIDDPVAFGDMRDAVDRFKDHARALLEAAEAASIRMYFTDCRENAPALA